MSGYVNLTLSENPCVSFTTRLATIRGTDLNANNQLDDGESAAFTFRKPFSDSLMAEVTNGWYIEGPGLVGRVQITGRVQYEEGDQVKEIIITSYTTYYSLQINSDYTFYSPGCI